MREDLISIIVPVYNAEKNIKKCLDSLVNQTLSSIEIIIIDDGSTDLSGEICDRYSNIYKNIKVIHQQNGGVSKARNKGLSVSNGVYIGFVDSDDTIDPTMFEKLLNSIKQSEADLCMCGYEEEGCDVNFIMSSSYDFNQHDTLKLIVADGCFKGYVWNKLFKKNIIKENKIEFKQEFSMCEDLSFCIDYVQYISNSCILSEKLYFYNGDSLGITKAGFNDKRWSIVDAYCYIMNSDLIRTNEDIYALILHRYIMHLLSLYNMLKKNNDKNIKKQYQNEIVFKISQLDNGFIRDTGYKIKHKIMFLFLKYLKRQIK